MPVLEHLFIKVAGMSNSTTGMTSSRVFIVNFERNSHLFLVFLLITLYKEILAGLLKNTHIFTNIK